MAVKQTISGDGNTAAVAIGRRGNLAFYAYGSFGGGTVKAQFSPDNGTTWIDLPNFTTNATAFKVAQLCPPGSYRFNTAGSTTPSITAELAEVDPYV